MNRNYLTLLGLLAVTLLFSSMLIPVQGQVRDCSSSLVTRVDADYNGPVYLDAYWTDRSASSVDILNPIEIEVGINEGMSTLAVVVVNRSQFELYAVTGFLKLPNDFEPGGISASPEARAYFSSAAGKAVQNVVYASHFDVVSEGEVFTFYFDVNVGSDVKIKPYIGSMIVDYSIPTSVRSCKSALLTVPFVFPGKVILDIKSDNNQLTPKISNTINITIENKGSADATGVVATISNLGDSSSSGSRDSSQLTLSSSETDIVNLGPNIYNIGTIPANDSITITTELFPDDAAAATVQNIDFQIEYGNAYGYRQTALLTTGLVISPNPSESSLIVSHTPENSPPLIIAGRVDIFDFEVTNNANTPLSDIVLSLEPESESVKIVGKTKFIIENLTPSETVRLETEIFAGTNLINTPTSFITTTDYIRDGESRLDTTTLGAFVSGEIELVLYDVAVTKIGNSLFVVGNVLNQGSTTGKFSTIEFVSIPDSISKQSFSEKNEEDKQPQNAMVQGNQFGSQSGSRNQDVLEPQYLGDLTDDSSIPFSIPLSIANLSPGMYPFTFKVTYADDLKNFHDIEFSENINVDKIQEMSSGSRQGRSTSDDSSSLFVVIGGIVAAGVAGVIVYKKRKSKGSFKMENKFNDDEDIEALLDESAKKS
jgi:LPXTG-motif cell wall-anchored protein